MVAALRLKEPLPLIYPKYLSSLKVLSKELLSLLPSEIKENPLGSKFLRNTLIKKFEELVFFIKVTMMTAGGVSGNESFSGCTHLTKINTDNITYFRGSTDSKEKAFYGTNVANVYLPNVVQLNQYCFQSGPSSVTAAQSVFSNPAIYVLGASLTTILSQYSFAYSYRKTFFIYAKAPPTGAVLGNQGYWYRTIYVPDDAWDAYQESESWGNLKTQIKKMSEYTGEKPWEELYPEELGLV